MSATLSDSTKQTEPTEISRFIRRQWLRMCRSPRLRRLLLSLVSLDENQHHRLLGIRLSRAEIGLLGEHLASKYLRQNGRKILFRNYIGLHRGEVDIVARHGAVLTFVEVKTRSSTAFGRPADAVTLEKQRLIQRGAQDWLRLLGNPRIRIRFDIVEVVLMQGKTPELNILENAFTLPDRSMIGR